MEAEVQKLAAQFMELQAFRLNLPFHNASETDTGLGKVSTFS